MGLDLATVQRLVAALLNLAVALLAGASLARLWIFRDASRWSESRRPPVRKVAIAGAAAALGADLAVLWLESAAMAEAPVSEAGAATWTMLSSTHFGLAWTVGFAGLAVAAVAAAIERNGKRWTALLALGSLAVFWYTRAMVSHAAGGGDFSLAVVADWFHLALISVWVGEVTLAGAVMLKAVDGMAPADRRARAAYIASLSSSATIALAGIVITGLYAAWRRLGGPENLFGNPYGNILAAKLLFVAVAATLGGFNRFVVMRPWLAHESEGGVAPPSLPVKFRRILRIEAGVLLAVLLLAAWLASTSPPGE